MTATTWMMTLAAVGCCWTLLSLLSGERLRRLEQVQARATPEPADAATNPASPSASPGARHEKRAA